MNYEKQDDSRAGFKPRKKKRGKTVTIEQAEARAHMLNALARDPKIRYVPGAITRDRIGVVQYYGDKPVGIA